MTLYNTSAYKIIYVFSIPDEAHKGLLKVGEATIHTAKTLDELKPDCQVLRDAADKGRIKDYTFTAGIKTELLWAELAVFEKEDVYKGNKITKIQGFRDHDVHNVLKNSGIKTCYPNGVKNREWFECNLDTAKNAIQAVKEGKYFLAECDKGAEPPAPKIKLRDEQNLAVEKTLNIFKDNDKMLWNCKMRFGKTVTAYDLIKIGKFQKTIVVTHRPVVEKEWEEQHGLIFDASSQHVFMKKQNLSYSEDYYDYSSDIKNDTALKAAKAHGDSFTYFASMQDLRGSKLAGGKYDKNKAVFAMDWDLIIYDEAHEGTQTDLGQTVQTLLETAKDGKKPKVLELSGTPYNIMDKYEDNVYTWDYVMEQREKEKWNKKHPDEINPYADMPKMNIFTFDMSKAIPTSYRYETETTAFNFREFFRVWTGETEKDFRPIPEGKKKDDFVHEDDVRAFLNLITTESNDTKYPFATDEFRKEFKHTFWMVPGVKEAKALSAVLKTHPVFMHYQIVNVAGEGDAELPYDNALELVRDAIKRKEYTITISCGKLTTGVTVREWTAVMMLTGSATTDAKGYMQTIFRVQSAGQIDGKQKDNCYVFDFAPDRALRVISDYHRLSNKGKTSDDKYKTMLSEFMNYCSVIAIEGTKMEPYNVNSLMRQIKRISIDAAIKSGFEDDSVYKVDAGIVMDENDKKFFEALKARLSAHVKSKRETKITIAENGLSAEEYEKARRAEHKPKKNLTPEEIEALEKLKAQRKQQQAFFALLRNISIRLPLLIYGAGVPITEGLPLAKFIEIVDEESWKEFMPQDVDKDLFKRSIKYFDEDVLMAAGLRIRRLTKQADEYPPTERIKRITEIISHFRNPDKETVLTPWRVVNMHMSDTVGGYCFLNERFDANEPLEEPRYVNQGKVTAELFDNKNSKILEINSKSGLYPLYIAYSLYRKRLPKKEEDMTLEEQSAIWNEVLKDNLFVLCKTTMARAITQRTLAGFTEAKTNTHYQAHLLERMQSDMDWVVKKITNPAVWGKEGERMKFDAIVGNPPYQEVISSSEDNSSLSRQLFPLFVETSIMLSPNYISLITPSRWFTGDAQDKSFLKLREFIKIFNHFRKIFIYASSNDIFSNVVIKGGVSYYLIDKRYKGNVDFIIKKDENIEYQNRPLFEEGLDIILCEAIQYHIILKIKNENFISFDTITKGRNAFGIVGKPEVVNKISYSNKANGLIALRCKNNEIRYTSPSNITKNIEVFKNYKVFVSKSAGDPAKDLKVIGTPYVAMPNEACTDSLIPIGSFESLTEAENLCKYLKTKFVRYLISILKVSQNVSQNVYQFVPVQDFTEKSDIDWSKSTPEIDKQLYAKYNLDESEIAFIESMIKPME